MDSKHPPGCQLPGCKKQIYYDSVLGKHHKYCSYGHANKANSGSQNYTTFDSTSKSLSSDNDNICKLPGCSRIRFNNKADGIIYDYCGKTHANAHKLNNAQFNTIQINDTNSEDQELLMAIELSLQNHIDEKEEPAAKFCNLCFSVNLSYYDDCDYCRNVSKESNWSCTVCTYDNTSLENNCAICNEARPKFSVHLLNSTISKSSSLPSANNSVNKTTTNSTLYPSDTDFDDDDDDLRIAIELSKAENTASQNSSKVDNNNAASNINNGFPQLITSPFYKLLPPSPPVPLAAPVPVPVPLHSSILNQLSCPDCNLLVSPDNPVCNRCHTLVEREWMCRNCTFDNSVKNSHCSMCGSSFVGNQSSNDSTSDKSTPTLSVNFPSDVQNITKCGLPGCRHSAVHYGYCSEDHRSRATERSMLVPAEDGVDRVFVGTTGDFTAHLLTKKHDKHAIVKAQFLQSWLKTDDGFPRVERIYWIRVNPNLMDAYQNAVKTLGNVERHFHGTSQHLDCMFGTNQARPPCSGVNCNVCSICQSSFDRSLAATGGGTLMHLRYGTGLYFSPVSSKSNDYNINSERIRYDGITKKDRRWRCMFLCSVVVGKSYVTQEGFLDANQCPPTGYDSVKGEAGKVLNYNEVVVYHQDQAIPSFLIVYSLPVL